VRRRSHGWLFRAAALGVAAAAATVGVVLSILTQRERFAHFEQHAVDYWMPWLEPPQHQSTLHNLLVPETRSTLGGTLVALSTFPASVVVSGVLVFGVAAVLWAHGRRRDSVVLCDAWIAADLIELVGKHLITRPELHQHSFGHHGTLPGLQHSLPSGHVIRALVLAAALAALGRAGRLAYLWALSVPVAVVVLGDHTPIDAAVGLAAGIALVAVQQAVAE